MIIYILLLLFTVSFAFFSRKTTNKILSKLFLGLSIFLMVLVAGIRWNVGTDFSMYESFFKVFKDIVVLTGDLEPMFMLFCYIPGRFFDTSTMTFFLIALFTYAIVSDVCTKNCKYYDLALFVFICFGFYFSSLNIVRQWMAIPLLLKLYTILGEKISFKHIFLLLAAYMCHYTSIFVFPFLFCFKYIKTDKTRIALIITFIFMKMSIHKVLPLVHNFFAGFGWATKYIKYFAMNNYISASLLIPCICLVSYALYYMFLKNKIINLEEKEGKKINILINILVFAFGFELIGMNVDIVERMSHYFYPIIILVLPKILEHIQYKSNKQIILTVLVLFSLLLFLNTMKNNGGEILPYRTIFSEVL